VNRLNTNDIWTLLAVIALTGIAAFLAAAETSLTRMSRARAMHLREEQRRGAAQLAQRGAEPGQAARALGGAREHRRQLGEERGERRRRVSQPSLMFAARPGMIRL